MAFMKHKIKQISVMIPRAHSRDVKSSPTVEYSSNKHSSKSLINKPTMKITLKTKVGGGGGNGVGGRECS